MKKGGDCSPPFFFAVKASRPDQLLFRLPMICSIIRKRLMKLR